jgi:hypothetical protein
MGNVKAIEAIKEHLTRITAAPWEWSYHPERPDDVIALEGADGSKDVLLCTGNSNGRAWGEIGEHDASFIINAPTYCNILLAAYNDSQQEAQRMLAIFNELDRIRLRENEVLRTQLNLRA